MGIKEIVQFAKKTFRQRSKVVKPVYMKFDVAISKARPGRLA